MLESKSTPHLEAFRRSCHFVAQRQMLLRSSCSKEQSVVLITSRYKATSSAKSFRVEVDTTSLKSLTYSKNSSGPRTEVALGHKIRVRTENVNLCYSYLIATYIRPFRDEILTEILSYLVLGCIIIIINVYFN